MARAERGHHPVLVGEDHLEVVERRPACPAISRKADVGSSCLRSDRGTATPTGTLVVALGSGLALAAADRSWRLGPAAVLEGLQGLRHRLGLARGRHALRGDDDAALLVRVLQADRQALGEELLHRERGRAPAFVMSPWKAVDSRASATTAVVPPPMGRAAVGVYGQAAGLPEAVAAGDHLVGAGRGGDIDDRGVDGAVDGPGEVGVAASHGGSSPRSSAATSVARLEVAERAGDVLAVVGERGQVGVGEGQRDDLLALAPPSRSSSATAWRRPGSCPRRWCPSRSLDLVAARSSRRRWPAGPGR